MSPDVNAGEAAQHATSRRDSLIARRYRIDSLIAAGGMGEVWRATDEVLGRIVSVKFLHPQFASDENFLERMLREARAASAVNHPGVVAVYDYGRVDPEEGLPTSYIVMEHVDGPSLSQILLDGPLTVDRTLTILEETAAALQAAHQAGVVHRDVKPGNIILDPSGHVKLTDFGIARSADTSTITDSGSITGTAHYLSPEQASGETATSASDLYSLGIVIYSCLSGVVPFKRDGPVAIALAHLQDPPPPLPEQIPAGVAELVMSLLEKKPTDRPADAEAVRAQAALLRSSGGGTEVVPPVVTATATSALEETASTPVTPGATAVTDATALTDATDTTGATGATEITPVQEEEPQRRDRRRLFLILGAALAAMALVAAYLVFGRGGGEPVTMPSLVGKSRAEAEGTLDKLGLDSEVDIKDVPKEKAGKVVGQSEEAGTQVDTGTDVVLTVASGLVSLPVEELIGSTYQDAKEMLAELGLTARRVTKPSGAAKGTVIDIGESTSRVDVGTTVDLVVAVPKPKPKDKATFTPTPNPTPKPTKKPTPTPTPTKTTPPPPADDVDVDGGTDTNPP